MDRGRAHAGAATLALLHLTKVAVDCDSVRALAARQAARVTGGRVPVYTGTVPKQLDALIGGSVFWIVRHVLAARQRIVASEPITGDPRWRLILWLDPEVVRVQPLPCRGHQGWRYLRPEHAPVDGGGLPDELAGDLAALGLL